MPVAFPVKTTNLTLLATSITQILAANPLRIYASFQFTPPAAGDVLIPFNVDGNNLGFLLPTGYQFLEFWIEKHKGMITQSWKYNRVTAAGMTMSIVEMVYGDPYGN